MPIGTQHLARYALANVWYPEGFGASTLSRSTSGQVIYKNFRFGMEMNSSPHPLVGGWPMGRTFDIQPFTWVYEIEMPIIIVPTSGTMPRLRTTEIDFWTAWMKYITGSYDQVDRSFSVVVEELGIRVTTSEVLLTLKIRANHEMGWGYSAQYVNYEMGRKARDYDTFVRYQPLATGNTPSVMWENQFLLSDTSIQFSSEHETINTTQTEWNVASDGYYYHQADMLNVKSVNYSGDLTVISPTLGSQPVSAQRAGATGASGTETLYNSQGDFLRGPKDSSWDYVFEASMVDGGLQIWVGEASDETTFSAQMLMALPKGLVVHKAHTQLSPTDLIKEQRSFHGVISAPPAIPGALPESWVSDI